MKLNNKKIFIIVSICVLLLVTISISYAYFSSILDIDGEANPVVTETGTLRITYNSGPQISAYNIYPGWSTQKTITVENTGTLDAYYSLDWFKLSNNIENDELIMDIACTSANSSCSGGHDLVVAPNAPDTFLSECL